MKTLVEHYHERQPVIRRHLGETETVGEAVGILQAELRQLADTDGAYIRGLTRPESRIAKSLLSILDQALHTLKSAKLQALPSEQPSATNAESTQDSQRRSTTIPDVTEALTAALTGALAGALATAGGGPIVGIPVGVVAGTAAGKVASQLKRLPGTQEAPIPFDKSQYSVGVDTDALLGYLGTVLETVDRTVCSYRDEEEEIARQQRPAIEDHPEVLEFLQSLMGDALDEDLAPSSPLKMRSQQISQLLRRYGIRAEVYDPQMEKTSEVDAYLTFTFEPSLEPESKEYVTLEPALVQGERVILRGRVVEPAFPDQDGQ